MEIAYGWGHRQRVPRVPYQTIFSLLFISSCSHWQWFFAYSRIVRTNNTFFAVYFSLATEQNFYVNFIVAFFCIYYLITSYLMGWNAAWRSNSISITRPYFVHISSAKNASAHGKCSEQKNANESEMWFLPIPLFHSFCIFVLFVQLSTAVGNSIPNQLYSEDACASVFYCNNSGRTGLQ